MALSIEPLSAEKLQYLHTANQPFTVIGRLRLSLQDGVWEAREELREEPYLKQYPSFDGAPPEAYIKGDTHAAFLAFDNGACVGQLMLSRTRNRCVQIEDISVAQLRRGQGIGTRLIQKAFEWGEAKGLAALCVECQDNNILATRFLRNIGFEIGGVSTALYRHLGAPYDSESAVFWYLPIEP